MNKTISINLGGIFFHIEDGAYLLLEEYFDSIAQHFANEEGGSEIVADIEARAAELFQENLKKARRQVVLINDVEHMISIMGHPEEFDNLEGAATTTTHGGRAAEEEQSPDERTFKQKRRHHRHRRHKEETGQGQRRLYRNTEDKKLAGVCSGISAYFGIHDPLWIRLLFAVSIFSGYGVLLYLLLWVIVPEAKTAAQKLTMKGKPINVSNIEKMAREGMSNLKSKLEGFGDSEEGRKTRFFFKQVGSLLYSFLPALLLIVLKVARILIVVIAAALLFGLAIALLGVVIGILSSAKFLLEFVFTSIFSFVTMGLSAFLFICIPVIFLSYFVFKQTFSIKVNARRGHRIRLGRILAIVWVLSFISLVVTAATTYDNDFGSTYQSTETIVFDNVTAKTMNIQHLENADTEESSVTKAFMAFPESNLHKTVFNHNENKIVIEDVTLDIERSNTDKFELVKKISAQGSSKKQAKKWAEDVQYHFNVQDSTIRFSSVVKLPADSKWRNQTLKLTLKVPVGKSVYLDDSAEEVIYDIKNTTNTYDGDMLSKTWTMKTKGLTSEEVD